MFAGDDKPLLPLLARIHQACLHCFKLQSPEVNLQRCSRCRRVSYCGAGMLCHSVPGWETQAHHQLSSPRLGLQNARNGTTSPTKSSALHIKAR